MLLAAICGLCSIQLPSHVLDSHEGQRSEKSCSVQTEGSVVTSEMNLVSAVTMAMNSDQEKEKLLTKEWQKRKDRKPTKSAQRRRSTGKTDLAVFVD